VLQYSYEPATRARRGNTLVNEHYDKAVASLVDLGFEQVPNNETNLFRARMTADTGSRIHPTAHPELNLDVNRAIKEESAKALANLMDTDDWDEGTVFTVVYDQTTDQIKFIDYQHRTVALTTFTKKRKEMLVDFVIKVTEDGEAGALRYYSTFVNPTRVPHTKNDDPVYVSELRKLAHPEKKWKAYLSAVRYALEGFGRKPSSIIAKQSYVKAINHYSGAELYLIDALENGGGVDPHFGRKMQKGDLRALFLIAIQDSSTPENRARAQRFFESVATGGADPVSKECFAYIMSVHDNDIKGRSQFDLSGRGENFFAISQFLKRFHDQEGPSADVDLSVLYATSYAKGGKSFAA
jgi:hypothetical protein